MDTPNIKTKIPDRAIASVAFACFSIFTLRVFGRLLWLPVQGGGPIPEQAIHAMSPILESLQIIELAEPLARRRGSALDR